MEKVACVTGAGGTLGREVALAFAQEGATLILCDRNKDALEAAAYGARKAGAQVFSGLLDVTEEAQVRDFLNAGTSKFGRLDVLVNAAGTFLPEKPLWQVTREEFEKVLRVNLLGAFFACKAVVPGMLRRAYGRIVNVTSSLSVVNMPLWGAYSCSKAALNALTRTLAEEVKGHNVLVNGVDPGAYRSPQNPQASATAVKAVQDVLLCATLPQKSIHGRFVAEGKDLGW